MNPYDPDVSPPPVQWLELDEAERFELVSAYHQRKKTRLPNHQLHAVIHVVVENQLALGESMVVTTLARLQTEGLSRHDALHAIGSVLAENLYELMHEDSGTTDETYRRYLDRLGTLSANRWQAG